MILILSKSQIFNDRIKPRARPRVDARNENYERNGGDVEIFDEKVKYNVKPRIDARNKNYYRDGGDVQVRMIF